VPKNACFTIVSTSKHYSYYSIAKENQKTVLLLIIASALALAVVGEGHPACLQAGVEQRRILFELSLLSMYNVQ